jgi:DNA adenine methylase
MDLLISGVPSAAGSSTPSLKKMTKFLRPPVKIHGGKRYLATWIIEHLPPGFEDMTYLEPFCGAASVLLNKPLSKEEVINDLDAGMIHIHRALRDECTELLRRLKKIPYTAESFQKALSGAASQDSLDLAINEFVLRRMSRGGLKKAFAWSDRQRGGRPGDENAWLTMLELLPDLAKRLSGVIILNKHAFEVIKAFNDPNTVLYCDPPYLHEARRSTQAYEIEMTSEEHMQLADVLNTFTGKVILSGYPSALYNRLYKHWRVEKKKIVNHASQQKTKAVKTEVLWMNYHPDGIPVTGTPR